MLVFVNSDAIVGSRAVSVLRTRLPIPTSASPAAAFAWLISLT